MRIYGVGFLSVPGAALLRFTGVNGKSTEAQGTILDDEVLECLTPKARWAGIEGTSCQVDVRRVRMLAGLRQKNQKI